MNMNPAILRHQLNSDGEYPVKIRIYFKKTTSYAPTNLKVSQRLLSRSYDIKDRQILAICNNIISDYEQIIRDNYFTVDSFHNANQLRDFLVQKNQKFNVDFFSYAEKIVSLKLAQGREQTAINLRRSLSAFRDFMRVRSLDITLLSVRDIRGFIAYLQTEHSIARRDQFGRMQFSTRSGVSLDTAKAYAVDLRTIFNEARREYNCEDVLIKNNPFLNIDLSRHQRSGIKTVDAHTIAMIFSYRPSGKLDALAQQVFCLSFCLCGTNCIDLYNMPPFVHGRAEFCRTKTAERRHDSAFISIKVPELAQRFIQDVRSHDPKFEFDFSSRYTNHRTFCRAVNDGLKIIAATISIPTLSTYYARHSWATIARNDCNVDVTDINLALNHVQPDRMTDIYIKKDWSRIDRANDAVLAKILACSSGQI